MLPNLYQVVFLNVLWGNMGLHLRWPSQMVWKTRRNAMKRASLIIALALIGLIPLWQGVFAAAQDVTGIWRSQVVTAFGMCYGETILMPKGRFSKTFRCGEMFTKDVGTYTVGEGYIHFNIQDHEPKVWKGKRMTWPNSETVFIEFVGPDRIICNDRITGGRWEATRVR